MRSVAVVIALVFPLGGCAAILGLDSGTDVVDDAGTDGSTKADADAGAASTGDAASEGATDSGPKCPAGFGDCNGNPNDGCETKLGDPGHCGSCTMMCPPMNLCVLEVCCADQNGPCAQPSDCCSNKCDGDKCGKP